MNVRLSKPNRRVSDARIRRRQCDVVEFDDGRISFEYLTRAEAERIYELACSDVKLYALTFALGTVLGLDKDEYDA